MLSVLSIVLGAIDRVAEAHPLLFGIVSAPGHTAITCFGLESDDPRLRDADWISGSREDWESGDDRGILGARAAEFLAAAPGEVVEIGSARFTVSAVIQSSNGFEDGGVFLSLERAQAFFHREGICSVVAVKLHDESEGEAFARAVEPLYPGLMALQNKEFQQSYSQFRIIKATSWAVGLCAFLIGGMGVPAGYGATCANASGCGGRRRMVGSTH